MSVIVSLHEAGAELQQLLHDLQCSKAAAGMRTGARQRLRDEQRATLGVWTVKVQLQCV